MCFSRLDGRCRELEKLAAKELSSSLQVVVLKLTDAVTGRRAKSAECCWCVASPFLGE